MRRRGDPLDDFDSDDEWYWMNLIIRYIGIINDAAPINKKWYGCVYGDVDWTKNINVIYNIYCHFLLLLLEWILS